MLQKEIRRGHIENAVMLAYEMLSTSLEMEELLWHRLQAISVEDVGMGELLAPVIVNALYQQHLLFKRSEGDRSLFAIHAVRYLCSRTKDRSSDEMLNWVRILDARGRMKPKIKDYAIDMHTKQGVKMGRGFLHFMEVGAVVVPELRGRDRTYRKRVLRFLKQST